MCFNLTVRVPSFLSFTMLNIYSFIHAPVALFGHAGVLFIRLIILWIAGFCTAVEGLVISLKILENLLDMVSAVMLLRLTSSIRLYRRIAPSPHRLGLL
jgi:hypothetical protein